ncbi:hypothetical protein PEPMIC_01259 [Parvimonas micra ATCC 33270]|uniref:Uncharacterized protein n=1 Tax=Parvimonas micra ATCC 33270 TaxID=411465 RepID=A8SMA8_9FIRM|nr:hypothetical protein PEPMIC_01259 [Parvimonas micra ATCC 33270]
MIYKNIKTTFLIFQLSSFFYKNFDFSYCKNKLIVV